MDRRHPGQEVEGRNRVRAFTPEKYQTKRDDFRIGTGLRTLGGSRLQGFDFTMAQWGALALSAAVSGSRSASCRGSFAKR
jgi:hypothetical protein